MLIRKATVVDAEGILNVRKSLIIEGGFFLLTKEEFQTDVEDQKKDLIKMNEQGGVTIVAEEDKRVVGFLTFRRNQMKRLYHTGTLGIGILHHYRNCGIGSQLLSYFIESAKQQDGLEKVSLRVLATNERAIYVYKKLGFQEEGREIRQIRFEDGQYVDDVIMALFL